MTSSVSVAQSTPHPSSFKILRIAGLGVAFTAKNSLKPGFHEKAAQSLGLPQKPIIHHIILPQALRIAVAPTCNVIIDMVKSSSLAAMITVPDIFQNAKIIGVREYDYMSMYILITFIYWVLSFILELLQGQVEKRLTVY
ncbi:ABC transporter permease subunit [Klebsiella pneumoniae]|nr:ABC transporter permease subunit [Klebsiella pneumoniae]